VTGDLPETSGGGAVIYPTPPISTPLSSNGGGGGQQRQTLHRRADVVSTDRPVMSTMAPERLVRPVMYLVIPENGGRIAILQS